MEDGSADIRGFETAVFSRAATVRTPLSISVRIPCNSMAFIESQSAVVHRIASSTLFADSE
jgi:hypothetical protein